MSISNLAKLASIAVRAEVLAVEARIGQAMRRMPFFVFGAVLVGAGLVLINVGIYAALTPLWGAVWAPVALGLFNVALGLVAFLVAVMLKPGPGMALADELRKMAAEQLVSEVRTLPFVSSTGGGFGSAALNRLIMRSIALALGRLLRGRKPEKSGRKGVSGSGVAPVADSETGPRGSTERE
jgi:hypothetical protein